MTLNTTLGNHHAIVTGGSRGIGRAIALSLAEHGAKVVINYNSNADAANEVASIIKEKGGDAVTVQANVGSTDDHQKMLDVATEAFGPVTLLVNNAGVAPKVRADVLQMTEESYDFVMDTNLKGPFLLTQRIANHMIESGVGRQGVGAGKPDAAQATDATQPDPRSSTPDPFPAIINISSMSAYTAHPQRGEYSLSKAGMGMMTAVFAARLAEYGIGVYEIRPGVIATDMTGPVKAKYDKLILEDERGITPIRRWGKPSDISDAILPIAEGKFPFSTGQVFNVDGGFHLHIL